MGVDAAVRADITTTHADIATTHMERGGAPERKCLPPPVARQGRVRVLVEPVMSPDSVPLLSCSCSTG
ncbi:MULTISPECIES: hypothetical protein [unclassified Streptomyces]|uniref:hypothetical protein n=1 Tax=unclassified Streptomyces TaxID=2593676 RepID=UPI0035DBE1A6